MRPAACAAAALIGIALSPEAKADDPCDLVLNMEAGEQPGPMSRATVPLGMLARAFVGGEDRR